jgi:hypothetical protein
MGTDKGITAGIAARDIVAARPPLRQEGFTWRSCSWSPKQERKTQMFKHMIRWIVVLAALLIFATALVLTPVLTSTHAAGTHSRTTQTTTVTPTSDATGGVMTPNMYWGH